MTYTMSLIPYSLTHFFIMFLFVITPFVIGRKISVKNRKPILFLSYLLLLLEIIRIGYLIFYGYFKLRSGLPLQLCFTIAYLLPIAIYSHRESFLCYVKAFACFYGTFAILLQNPNQSIFMVFHSYLYHALLILIGILLIKEKKKYDISHFNTNQIIFFTHIIIAVWVNSLLEGANYIFLNTFFHPEQFYFRKDPVIRTLENIQIQGKNIYDIILYICDTITLYGYQLIFILLMCIMSFLLFYITNRKKGSI